MTLTPVRATFPSLYSFILPICWHESVVFSIRRFVMEILPRDLKALTCLSRYHILNSKQLRALCFQTDNTGRVVRRRMNQMKRAGLIRQRRMQVVNETNGSPSPVFHLTKEGREYLAGHFDDPSFLLKPVDVQQAMHLAHYVTVSDAHIMLDQAIEQQSVISMPRWVNEDEWVNVDESNPKNRFRLFTKFDKTVCAPDAAMILECGGDRAVMYIESDRDSYFYERVAARKSPAYKTALESKQHQIHFGKDTLPHFYVIVFSPTEKRSRQLRDAFAKKNADSPVLSAYRFGAFETLTPENILTAPVFRCCHKDELVPLVKVPTTDHTVDSSETMQRSGTLP